MQFVLEPNNIDNLMEQFYQNCRSQRCNRFQPRQTKWQHTINLTGIPTKPEDFNLKLENSNILTVSGKSDVTKEQPNGFKVFSTHNWSKQINIPENVDQTTLSAKMPKDTSNIILTISAELKKDQTEKAPNENEFEIPIEKLD